MFVENARHLNRGIITNPNPMKMKRIFYLACFALCFACGESESPEDTDSNITTEAQSLVTCSSRRDTGYRRGNAFAIRVVSADGKPCERATANAYSVMQRAAARDGVTLRIVSGFRTMAEQRRLYSCYVNCNCNGCNLAARPGYSNHQSGHALDLNTNSPGVFRWLLHWWVALQAMGVDRPL